MSDLLKICISPNVVNQVVVGILSGAIREFSSSEEHDDDE
jgi:hypothetical protein